MNNRVCKTCGIEYHHCNNCGYGEWYDEDAFCSDRCAKQDLSYLACKKQIEDFVESLNEIQKEQFAKIICDIDIGYTVCIIEDMGGFEGIAAWGLW